MPGSAISPRPTLVGALGEYEVLERIGRGGMAEVLRARHLGVEGFERIVAIKRILPGFARDPLFVAMFLDEARLAARLNHPNIAKTLDLGLSNGRYFIVMEHIAGFDMGALFRRCRRLGARVPLRHACRVVSELCAGLAYAHELRDGNQHAKLVHRDVSTSNVLVSDAGEVRLIDFGVAKATRRRAWTSDGILKGNPAYLAPEQLLARPVDHRADIYGAGVVLWELLTTRRLFPTGGGDALLDRIRGLDHTPSPSSRNPSVPRELDRIAARALARDPDDRYQTAAELADALHDYVRRSGQHSSARALATWTARLMSAEHARTAAPPTRLDVPRLRRRASGEITRQVANRNLIRRAIADPPSAPMHAASAVRLSLVSEPPGADVFVIVGGARTRLGTTPLETRLPGGTAYAVSMHRPGHQLWTSTIALSNRGTLTVYATLRAVAPRPGANLRAEAGYRSEGDSVGPVERST